MKIASKNKLSLISEGEVIFGRTFKMCINKRINLDEYVLLDLTKNW